MNKKKIPNSDYWLVRIKYETISLKPFMIVSWSSLITAMGRIQLIDLAQKVNAIYVDTDSIVCKNLPEELSYLKGKELGKWKIEHICKEFRALAPKFYAMRYFDEEKKKMIHEVKCKGVSSQYREKLFNSIKWYKEGSITVKGIHKFLSYRESLNRNNPTYKSGLTIGANIFDKVLNPKLK